MNNLDMYTRLFIIRSLFKDQPESIVNGIISETYHRLTDDIIPKDLVPSMLSAKVAPQMNQLIPKMLYLGYAPNYLASLFEITPAAVSKFKLNPSKKAYRNPYYEFVVLNTNYRERSLQNNAELQDF